MERFLAVDSGKENTKICIKRASGKEKYSIPTRVDEVNILAEPEKDTDILVLDGKAYRIGKGATTYAPKEDSKKSIHHKLSVWAAIAKYCDSNDEINIATGCPLSLCENATYKKEYGEYILPKNEPITVELRTTAGKMKKTFTIKNRMVCPEGSGFIFSNPQKFEKKLVAIIDDGGLNLQVAMFDDCSLVHNLAITRKYGGRIFIDSLTDAINAEFATDFDRKLIESKMYSGDKADRFIRTSEANSKEKSAKFIEAQLTAYVKEVFRIAKEDGKVDPYNIEVYMQGGTSELIKETVQKLYGSDIHFVEEPEFANAEGWLNALLLACGK
ncbi:MAG: ParM/StbA family protein [Pseudobutyrivibrio ruminis]|uniref:ParM/StbA family protein n=1 Tax=Pseudobutyrivibrio ruminis TaxID=46206 RepID=A0A927U7K7_9FIRM|nr:ParM/StbA family protein [Pseudobutyrivibrio ruminis]